MYTRTENYIVCPSVMDRLNKDPDVLPRARWDCLGCQSSTCCELNTPPWFCKTLPAPTTDDIELRSCYGDGIKHGNVTITNVDIYIS